MAAALGNEYWKLRTTHGAPNKFTQKQLAAACDEYFDLRGSTEWNGQPLPYTQQSLCIFLGITADTWIRWRETKHDLSEIVTYVDSVLREQTLTGAMVGAYNSAIVARYLGMADKQENKTEHTVSEEMQKFLTQVSESPRLAK